MRNRQTIIQSFVIAVVIGFVFPIAWVSILGTTIRTPVIEKSYFDDWSQEKIQEWVNENSVQVSFPEHTISTIKSVANEPTQYIEASVYIFLLVFVINWLIIGKKKNAP